MRIVAGTLRGRTIEAPAGDGTRPTTDRVREALFSSLFSLRGGFDGAIVLDAFAGSGALGIEALSRGAQAAVFYERDRRALAALRRNVEECGVGARARVVARDVLGMPPDRQDPPFDLVFLDPPYDYRPDAVLGMVCSIAEGGALRAGAIAVYEHDAAAADAVAAAAAGAGFSVRAQKRYGKTSVSVLIWDVAEGAGL